MTFEKKTLELVVPENKPFSCCHASTLLPLPNGEVLVSWFGGSKEGADDVAIWLSRRKNGRWSFPIKVADDENAPNWNPSLFRKQDGTLLLLYKAGREISQWCTKVLFSKDEGETWSAPQELVPGDRGGRGPVRNKIIRTVDGILLAPASSENGPWRAFVDTSKDEGRTWIKSAEISIPGLNYQNEKRPMSDIPVSEQSFKGRGVIQPTLWESGPGKVHMLLRSTEDLIYRSDSEDGGLNWTDAYPTDLPNNNSGIDVAKLGDGALVLAYNPVGVNWGPRTPLSLACSRDNGKTWENVYDVVTGPGEYSYPAILADGNKLFLSFTWRRENIAYCEFQVSLSAE